MNIFVTDSNSRLLRKIVAATGEVTTIGSSGDPPLDGTRPAACFAGVEDVVSDRAGNVDVVDSYASRKLVVATSEVTTLASRAGTLMVVDGIGATAGFLSPKSITYDGVGNLFIAESSPGVAPVRKLNLQSRAVKTVAGKSPPGVQLGALPGSLNHPRAVAAVPGFGLAISAELENSILLAHGLQRGAAARTCLARSAVPLGAALRSRLPHYSPARQPRSPGRVRPPAWLAGAAE